MLVDKIQQLCKEHNISFRKFGIAIGIESKSISRWDTNRPSIDKVLLVADYFDVSIDYLMGRTDEKKTATSGGLPDDVADIIRLLRSDPRLKAFVVQQVQTYKTLLADPKADSTETQ